MKTDLIQRAAIYAAAMHAGQMRKYGGGPYIAHPARVAAAVAALPGATDAMVAAAWLHDTAEDCGAMIDDLARVFGADVAGLVDELTNRSKQTHPTANRAQRKAIDIARIAEAGLAARKIKLVDRLDNLKEVANGPLDFIALYCKESAALLAALKGTDTGLEAAVAAQIATLQKGR